MSELTIGVYYKNYTAALKAVELEKFNVAIAQGKTIGITEIITKLSPEDLPNRVKNLPGFKKTSLFTSLVTGKKGINVFRVYRLEDETAAVFGIFSHITHFD